VVIRPSRGADADTMARPAGCRCTHEAGDSPCEVHPTCACCGEPVRRLGQACSWDCARNLRPAWAPLLQGLPMPDDVQAAPIARPPPTSIPGPGVPRELPDDGLLPDWLFVLLTIVTFALVAVGLALGGP
jgi:hypothetical protein